jgi:hypothetical protein
LLQSVCRSVLSIVWRSIVARFAVARTDASFGCKERWRRSTRSTEDLPEHEWSTIAGHEEFSTVSDLRRVRTPSTEAEPNILGRLVTALAENEHRQF